MTVSALLWLIGVGCGAGFWALDVGLSAAPGISPGLALMAPQGWAFSIWPVVYVGLVGYLIWQWLPHTADTAWAGLTRIPAALSILLNGVWLAMVVIGWIWPAVIAMFGILFAAGLILDRTVRLTKLNSANDIFTAATMGLYLGWIAITTCAAIALSWTSGTGAVQLAQWLVTGLGVLIVGGAAYVLLAAHHSKSRTLIACVLLTGMAWVSIARFTEAVDMPTLGWGIAAGAAGTLLGGASAYLRRHTKARTRHTLTLRSSRERVKEGARERD